MESPKTSSFIILLLLPVLALLSASSDHELGHQISSDGGRRVLLGFKETFHGSNNVSFDCSPSGPCIPCFYSEKNDEKYRCSETGYRIPFKCIEIEAGSKVSEEKKSQKSRSTLEVSPHSEEPHVILHDTEQHVPSVGHRSLLDVSSSSKGGLQSYITYRSCIPAANEEKLSVLGFEGIVLFMLMVSGLVVYFKRKNSAASGAPMRIPTSSRF